MATNQPGRDQQQEEKGGRGSRPVRVQELVRVMVAPLPPSRPITHTSLIPGILTPLPHPPSNHRRRQRTWQGSGVLMDASPSGFSLGWRALLFGYLEGGGGVGVPVLLFGCCGHCRDGRNATAGFGVVWALPSSLSVADFLFFCVLSRVASVSEKGVLEARVIK